MHKSKILFRSVAIFCILYYYLTSAGVVPNFTATAASPCARSLRVSCYYYNYYLLLQYLD
jgi:hypothetical protein